MAVDLSKLTPLTTAAQGLSNMVMVTPYATGLINQKDNKTFLFNFEGENKTIVESDVTDHVTERNTPLNDQIAIKPESYTVQGFIGEITDIAPDFFEPANDILSRLLPLAAYVPELTTAAILAYNDAVRIYNTGKTLLNNAVNAFDFLLSGEVPQTKQQIAFGQLYGYMKSQTLFSVRTPWNLYTDMVIQRLVATQSAETRMISDFEITFKKLYFASTVNISVVQRQERNDAQNQAKQVNGNVTTEETSVTQDQLITIMTGGN